METLKTYHDTVIGGEYCKLVQSRYQVPACSDVARNEYTEGKNGKRVH